MFHSTVGWDVNPFAVLGCCYNETKVGSVGFGTGYRYIFNVYSERLRNGEENIMGAEKIVGGPCYAMASHLIQLLPAWKIENTS